MSNETLTLVGDEALNYFEDFLNTNASDVEMSSDFPEGTYMMEIEQIDVASVEGRSKHLKVFKKENGDWAMFFAGFKCLHVIDGGGDTPEQAAKQKDRVFTAGMMVVGKNCPDAVRIAAACMKMSVDEFQDGGGSAIPMRELLPALSGNKLVLKIVNNKKGKPGISFKKGDPLMHPDVWEANQQAA